jgi:hypothetical protein
VNWLTHAKNAVRMDAEIGLKAVEHLLGMFTAARLRLGRASVRCGECGSYQLVGGECRLCGWVDPAYEPPQVRELSEEERARRLATPCVPSSDISTFMGPDDARPARDGDAPTWWQRLPAQPEGEARPRCSAASWARARRARGSLLLDPCPLPALAAWPQGHCSPALAHLRDPSLT